MSSPRKPSNKEKSVITALLQGKTASTDLVESLEDLLVEEINDDGIGSLLLVPKELLNTNRSFGRQVVMGEFTDTDGVPVSLSMNVDTNGNLYELDVWKVDFSKLLTWPDPTDIRIVDNSPKNPSES